MIERATASAVRCFSPGLHEGSRCRPQGGSSSLPRPLVKPRRRTGRRRV